VTSPPTYGVLGVGAIARAIVTGLCEGIDVPPAIVLSPRGAAISTELASRYPTVSVAVDNQAVVDGSDVVLVCLRRADAELLGDLTWRADHVVVSAVAGVGMPELRSLVAPAARGCRSVPMPPVAALTSLKGVDAPDFAELAAEYATPGGVNEQVARELREHGSFEVLKDALDGAFARLAT
jgi:pyrroline-5-carboxylate reductase